MTLVDTLFGTSNKLDWWQECDRALVVFAYGLLVVRVAGRRIFGKWAALDIVVSVIVGSNLSRTVTGSAELLGTLVATTLLVVVHWVLAQAAARWPAVSRLLEGSPEVLARDGVMLPERRRKHSVTEADMEEALRKVSVADVAQTRAVTLEPSGAITVVKRS